jgi:hypothetical protein
MTAGNTVKLIASVNITIASSMLFLRRYEALIYASRSAGGRRDAAPQ